MEVSDSAYVIATATSTSWTEHNDGVDALEKRNISVSIGNQTP
jgi:hypothetical protein